MTQKEECGVPILPLVPHIIQTTHLLLVEPGRRPDLRARVSHSTPAALHLLQTSDSESLMHFILLLLQYMHAVCMVEGVLALSLRGVFAGGLVEEVEVF